MSQLFFKGVNLSNLQIELLSFTTYQDLRRKRGSGFIMYVSRHNHTTNDLTYNHN